MRTTASALMLLAILACRGEPVPRDYQNHPPAMTHPADSSAQAPSQHGMPGAMPEPNRGVEGKTQGPVDPVVPSTTTSTAPATSTTPSGTHDPEGGTPQPTTTTRT